ncbi:MAG: hypothetical protein FJZ01_14750 [Candidatus Sericytochromatia bacterium]|nr:hypothetical protein [Candidatus Tanganyikabacteria bacterium]
MRLRPRHCLVALIAVLSLAGCGVGKPQNLRDQAWGGSGVGARALQPKQIRVVPIERNRASATLPNFQEGVLLASFMGDGADGNELRFAASLGGPVADALQRTAATRTWRPPAGRGLAMARPQARVAFEAWLAQRSRHLLPGARPWRGRAPARQPQLDDRQTFFIWEQVKNDKGEMESQRKPYSARLEEITARTYFYVDERYLEGDIATLAPSLREIGKHFEEVAIPADTKYFGDYPLPPNDVDGDPRLTVLFTKMPEGVGGYFNPGDAFKEEVSNARDMLYMSADALKAGSLSWIKATLIHELYHMINFNHKWVKPVLQGGVPANERPFLNEGIAVLAEQLGGFGLPAQEESAFFFVHEYLAQNPSAQLTADNASPEGRYKYGSGYLFNLYLLEQYGPEVLRKLTQSPKAGIENVEMATGRPFADIFRDWAITLYASGYSADPRYNYKSINLRQKFRWSNGAETQLDGLAPLDVAEFPDIQAIKAQPWSIIPIRFLAPGPGQSLTISLTGSNWAGLQATVLDAATLREP